VRRSGADAAALTATVGAALIIAHQVAAKATRDALFTDNFQPDQLPLLKIGSALISIIVLVFASRVMVASGPGKLVPAGFAASGVLHLAEWLLSSSFPAAVAVLLYLHFAGLGAMLISGFWSLVNERFDPHTAKKRVAQIAAAATAGALIGGGIPLMIAPARTTSRMLLVLCCMHLLCGGIVWLLGSRPDSARLPIAPAPAGLQAGAQLMRRHSFLRDLALLVFIGAACATLIDLVFIARTAALENRLRFFALFHASASVAGLAIQVGMAQLLLQKSGLGFTAAFHQATVTLGSLGAVVPGVASIAVAKGSEQAVHNSLFRSAYELFYTPLPRNEKRCVKTFIDVGFERIGDISGSTVGKCLSWLNAGAAESAMLGVAAGAGLVGIWITRRLDRGYVGALERSLRNQAVDLKLEEVTDHTTRVILLRTSVHFPASAPLGDDDTAPPLAPSDPLVRRTIELRCGDPVRVGRALEGGTLDSRLAAHAIELLGWDEVAEYATRALRAAGPGITGQLLDALLDEGREFAVRRRIPRVLSAFPSERAVDGLLAGLGDKRFEVRYRCGMSLAAILSGDSGLKVAAEDVFRAVSRELEVGRHLWESYRLLDGGDGDQLLGDRANRAMEHVFTLLSLVLPKEPLRISLYALHTGDEMLRGTALEYLETALPSAIRARLWPLLDDKRPKDRVPRSPEEALAALLESHQSIQAQLHEIKTRAAPHP
jgi:hypothetical protein